MYRFMFLKIKLKRKNIVFTYRIVFRNISDTRLK